MSAIHGCKQKIESQKEQLDITRRNVESRQEIYDLDKSYVSKDRLKSAKRTVDGVQRRLGKLEEELARLERTQPNSIPTAPALLANQPTTQEAPPLVTPTMGPAAPQQHRQELVAGSAGPSFSGEESAGNSSGIHPPTGGSGVPNLLRRFAGGKRPSCRRFCGEMEWSCTPICVRSNGELTSRDNRNAPKNLGNRFSANF